MDLSLPSNIAAEEDKDTLGGGFTVDSDVYKGVVELAYLGKSDNGAISITIHFNNGKQVVKQTTYISNRAGGFTYKNDKGEHPLPGYSQMNTFFLAATGKTLDAQTKEEKVITVYDFVAKKEMPVARDVFMDVLNVPLAIGILKVSEEKTTKSEEIDSKGKPIYKGNGEYRDINVFDKYFDSETGMTITEKTAKATSPEFLNQWKEKNKGEVRIVKAKVAGTSTPGAPAGAKPAAVATPSIFK